MRTASALYSGVNDQRLRVDGPDFFVDTVIVTGERWEVSTKTGQA
jgi:hypothetical protein